MQAVDAAVPGSEALGGCGRRGPAALSLLLGPESSSGLNLHAKLLYLAGECSRLLNCLPRKYLKQIVLVWGRIALFGFVFAAFYAAMQTQTC